MSEHPAFLNGQSEKLVELAFLPDGTNTKGKTLEVGVTVMTKDIAGRQLIPTHVVSFAVGQDSVSVGPSMARDLAKRIIEFCDHAETLNKDRASWPDDERFRT